VAEADFLKLVDRADLQKLVDEGLEEGLMVEYKASPALTRDGKGPDELCKDVSAMANSAGGQIIYCIEEDKKTHRPARIDDGITDPQTTAEWIEQTLNSRVQPRMRGIRIYRIKLAETSHGFVISIPPTSTGPHQAPDKKYYRRFNLQAVPMHDYEIRDVMRRASTPVLTVRASIANARRVLRVQKITQDRTNHIPFNFHVSNLSEQPAEYAALLVYLDPSLSWQSSNIFSERSESETVFGRKCNVYRVELGMPSRTPIFKGVEVFAGSISAFFVNNIPSRIFLGTRVLCPGFTESRIWPIEHDDGEIEVHPNTDWSERWVDKLPAW